MKNYMLSYESVDPSGFKGLGTVVPKNTEVKKSPEEIKQEEYRKFEEVNEIHSLLQLVQVISKINMENWSDVDATMAINFKEEAPTGIFNWRNWAMKNPIALTVLNDVATGNNAPVDVMEL